MKPERAQRECESLARMLACRFREHHLRFMSPMPERAANRRDIESIRRTGKLPPYYEA